MKILKTVLALALYWIIYQLTLPTLSLAYLSGMIFFAIGALILSLLIMMWISNDGDIYLSITGITGGIIVIILIVGFFIGSAMFNSETMYSQIGEIQNKSFVEDIVEIDNSQIPIVDIKLANKLADKKMGENTALGSQMEVGTFTNKQQINGKLVYVAPLEHRGFWKWKSNSEGTIGYVVVSATNTNDVKMVKELDENPIKLKYLESAYFSSDLKRHVRSSGFRTQAFTDFMFELDDDGRPYWITSTYRNTTLWANPEVTGVIICDAQTGECKKYSIEETPEWVDIIQPENFVKEQIKHYGKYVHGFFNWSNKDELEMTEHITTVYNEGNCYYYTGMSSVGKDNGTVGFIMVNTRTKKATMYKMVGATEEASMRSIEGKVQNMKYDATTPIPLNISGIPTYFLTLKDKEGLVKGYGMVNIEDYSIVANGSSIMEAKRAYINAMTSAGNTVDFSDEVYGYTAKGTVSRITSNVENGNTFYYMILDEDKTKLYMASYTISEELPITREGDKVEVSYIDEANGTINIVTFDNMEFVQDITSAQQEKNKEKEQNNIINNSNNNITNVDPEKNQEEWDSLTDEEKAKLLQKVEENKD